MNKTGLFLSCVLSAVVLVALSGCDSRRRSTPGTGVDAGSRDLGGILVDLGTGPVDMGMARVDMGSACTITPVDYVSGAYCSATTQSCIAACTDGTCIGTCLDADANPDCSTCANINVIACANMNGCVDEWNTYDCCYATNCPTGSATTCGETYCATQRTAYSSCLSAALATATCTNDYTSCY